MIENKSWIKVIWTVRRQVSCPIKGRAEILSRTGKGFRTINSWICTPLNHLYLKIYLLWVYRELEKMLPSKDKRENWILPSSVLWSLKLAKMSRYQLKPRNSIWNRKSLKWCNSKCPITISKQMEQPTHFKNSSSLIRLTKTN